MPDSCERFFDLLSLLRVLVLCFGRDAVSAVPDYRADKTQDQTCGEKFMSGRMLLAFFK